VNGYFFMPGQYVISIAITAYPEIAEAILTAIT
jgi:hypothetical protein